jgi:hypothetical protein
VALIVGVILATLWSLGALLQQRRWAVSIELARLFTSAGAIGAWVMLRA